MKTNQKELTKAEEQIMQVLWECKEAFVKDVVNKLPEPKPAYTTVATIMRILEEKGFVNHEEIGKSYRYKPSVSKGEYRSFLFKNIFKNYFNGSPEGLLSHFMSDRNLSVEEMDELLKKIKKDDE